MVVTDACTPTSTHTRSAGETRKLKVPPALGYGEYGNGAAGIPPNAKLIYELEVVAVEDDDTVVEEEVMEEPSIESLAPGEMW